MRVYSTILLSFVVSLLAFGHVAFAAVSFQLAPPRNDAPPATTTRSDDSTSKELKTIAEWETKISNAIPVNIRTWIAGWETTRLEKAKEFAQTRDSFLKPAPTAKGTQAKAQTTSLPMSYYWYAFLAFYFLHGYVFYGVLVSVLFFIVRTILYRLNLIV
jgi:hypothetical protein